MSQPADSPDDARLRAVWLVLSRGRPAHLAFLRRRLASDADAEDILQLAWMQAARHLDELQAEGRLEPWFWRILRNTLTDELRRLGREQKAVMAHGYDDEPPKRPELCGCSLSVLEEIRPEYRDVIRMADLDEHSMQELADRLGLSLSNATVRLHRARKAMRDALRERCGTVSVRGCQDCGCEGVFATPSIN